MNLLALASMSVVIMPVALDAEILRQPETFVSPAGRILIEAGAQARLYCMDLPEGRFDYSRACITADEWQQVSDRIAQDESADRRFRAILQAHNSASRPALR
ncbi:hypothetical protein [Aurantiacibacter luteus]|uniref:Uncharacterized protein n=1 Tax=Aurantiacibacter luteus TaxID=1581420 RepID=A0A0G9MXU3_9SPHN|nr:hypothetical protein [Aurantiacibacter luteus]KLE35607.1 hypothetical protein AAW00_04130 [Aurantiacibacter luteus]